jgi:hypothetical protein
MDIFDQPAERLYSYQPFPPVWRMMCRCWFRAGGLGEIAACECRFWWRVNRRGRWYAISRRRAFRALRPDLLRGLSYFEATGEWPAA